MGIIRYYDLEEAEVFIFDEFIINQIKEGVIIEPHHNHQLNEIIKEHFMNREMVYISNRVKSYSVNPLIYPETEAIPNLVAIAIIPLTAKMKENAIYERNFFDKPYEIFESLGDALQWVHIILKRSKHII